MCHVSFPIVWHLERIRLGMPVGLIVCCLPHQPTCGQPEHIWTLCIYLPKKHTCIPRCSDLRKNGFQEIEWQLRFIGKLMNFKMHVIYHCHLGWLKKNYTNHKSQHRLWYCKHDFLNPPSKQREFWYALVFEASFASISKLSFHYTHYRTWWKSMVFRRSELLDLPRTFWGGSHVSGGLGVAICRLRGRIVRGVWCWRRSLEGPWEGQAQHRGLHVVQARKRGY